MSDPVDVLEAQLLQAGYRLQRSRLSSGRLQISRRGRMAAAAVTALFVVTPAIAAVTQTWPGDADRGTAAAPRIQIPTSDTELDASLRAAFSVLRRGQTKADELPAEASLPPVASGVQLSSARRLLQTPQGGVFLVAVDAILPKPVQVLPEGDRIGPPGICAALTADAPATFSCASTRQILGPAAGVSFQTAACVPGRPSDTVSLQGLAVDQVSGVTAVLTDGSSTPIDVRSNVIDARFASADPPRQLRWTYNGDQVQRDVTTPSQTAACEPKATP